MTTGGALSIAMAGTSSCACLWPDSLSLCTFDGLTDGACGRACNTYAKWNSKWNIGRFALRFHFSARV